MTNRFNFRKFFIGEQTDISSAELKRLMLTGFLSTMSLTVSIFYAIFDLVNEVYYSQPAYAILAISSVLTIVFLRHNKHKLAKILLIVSTNFVVFWSAIIDPFETGVFLFFIPTGIGSYAMLSAEDLKLSITLTAFTTVLFLVAYFTNFKPVDVPVPTGIYIQISFILNYFISLTISILAIVFLINLNKISERELIQKEIFANQKNAELQKVNIELDRFVYSVSHDLRSPLSSIQGLINLAKFSNDTDEIKELLVMIQDRVNSQDHFIQDIIDYARNARTETISEAIYLKTLVENVINSLRFSHHADKIAFIISVTDDTIILSDRIRLNVILSNLIGNAIKYHDVNKPEPVIEIGFHKKNSCIFIRDNGTGIPVEHQDKIFNMFYRGSENSKGSGLGLFITKEMVTRLGGTISVRSNPESGSTFEVIIPSLSV